MKLIRYFFVGGVAAVVDFLLFALFAQILGYHYLLVAACTFILATIVNYVLSIRHVFESGIRFSKRHEIALVFLVSGGGLLINQCALYLLVDTARLHLLVAKVIVMSIVFFWNYLLRAELIFRPVKG